MIIQVELGIYLLASAYVERAPRGFSILHPLDIHLLGVGRSIPNRCDVNMNVGSWGAACRNIPKEAPKRIAIIAVPRIAFISLLYSCRLRLGSQV